MWKKRIEFRSLCHFFALEKSAAALGTNALILCREILLKGPIKVGFKDYSAEGFWDPEDGNILLACSQGTCG